MDRETFLMGMKNIDLCHPYAKKFRNTYLSYIEKEKISKQNDSYWNNVTEDNFDEQYEVKWNKKWFYIGNKIEQFYNEMGWDIQKLYANKTVEYLAADDIYYRNFVIQDIWDNLLKEQDEKELCWAVMNFISVLQNTEEQNELKNNLNLLMGEIFEYPLEAYENNEKALMDYIKGHSGIPCAFGDIEIDIKNNRLGQGGNGVVFSGVLGKYDVAVKFLINYSKKKLERFKAEYINVNIVRERLKHTVSYLNYETLNLGNEAIPFIVMKKYDVSLKKARLAQEEVSWDNLMKLFNDLCLALKSLEENNIIHRDLKPENILMDQEGNYIVTDFGIAHFEDDKYPIKDLTKKGDRLANWEFSAPEQINNGQITPATDIYALGQILYWYCFGSVNRGTGGRHLQEIFQNDNVGKMDAIIYKCLSNEPMERFQSIEEIENEYNQVKKRKIDVYDDMYTFNDVVRSVLPEAYRLPYETENSKIIEELIQKLDEAIFNQELWYNTGLGNNEFTKIEHLKNGNYLLCGREIIIEKIYALVTNNYYDDLLILKIENPALYMIDGEEYDHIMIINNEILEPYYKIESGYCRFKDGHVESFKNLDIQERTTYRGFADAEKYIVIGVQEHCSIISENDQWIEQLQEHETLSPEIMRDLQKNISKNKTYNVRLGI
ncbi:serine/threonine protein kinase [Faecalicatena fissicatena]|uniref:serine/threonine protein kinase n=1 Tax=Faecalicatena fissicatena TaxID=290055 RepID=UPI00156F16E2|nr:serine/threonine-protein kinase [Faecalicatena fissicatena]NSE31832.1 serine/threonine protein kinase [Faecalicatena fissicatena]